MSAVRSRRSLFVTSFAVLVVLSFVGATAGIAATHTHTSTMFMGVKANTGTVTHSKEGMNNILTLSEDFKVPDTPAPHWQVVDSKGNTYLLQRLVAKGDKYNKAITLPPYIHDIARVQIWCAFAETLLGEASFESPVR